MEQENKDCCSKKGAMNCCGASGAVYGLGLIGAVVYYIQHSDTFWVGVVGVLKAIVWPAILVYKLIELLSK